MKPDHRRTLAILTALFLILPASLSAKTIDYPFWPGVVVVKVMPGYLPVFEGTSGERTGVSTIDRFLIEIGATKFELKFIDALPPTSGGVDITRFYNVYFPESLSVPSVCRDFLLVEGIELAEPWQIDYVTLDHNDSRRGEQYALNLCEANAAHDISTGNRDLPIAIVDTGVALAHQDLAANIWVNPREDLNGDGQISQNERNDGNDDDRNGRLNDFYGWDFVGNDNDPTDTDGHGTHCAGDASAVTNNRNGVASVGYSCAIMAVRTGTGGQIQFGYEGITYAVRTGAKVISCSWGGNGGNDWTFQTVQAALQNDVLVLCAAGNDNSNGLFYPANYAAVVAVAATGQNDRKAGFSNYGDWVDVSSPGVGILSTVPGGNNNNYAAWDGTSMACPVAAGVAILLRTTFPELTANEARTLLLQGADNIDNLNPNYRGQLGSGRINARRTLELANRPRLAIDTLEILSDNNNNGQLDPGENLEVSITISNGANGRAAEGVSVSLSTDDPNITFDSDTIAYEDMAPGDVLANAAEPFVVNVDNEAIPHTTWITATVDASPGDAKIERTFELVIGHPPILLVDDDEGTDYDQYYLQSIEGGNRGWVHWNVANNYSPDATTLSDYDMVIWETGDAVPPLDDLDRYQIEAALNDGAKIMLIGNRIGDDEQNRDLLRNFFGARHELDSTLAYTVNGLNPDRPLGAGVQMMLTGEGGANNGRISPSTMSPVLGADSLAVYYVGARPMGVAGVYRNIEHLHSKAIYLGFSFESVTNARTTRAEVIDRLYNWFTGNINSIDPNEANVPTLISLDQAYPNPFNGTVNLRFAVPVGFDYILGIYEMSGREVASIASGTGQLNNTIASWNASNFPAGVYFARLGVDGASPLEQRLVLVK